MSEEVQDTEMPQVPIDPPKKSPKVKIRKANTPIDPGPERVFEQDLTIHHDLFRLEGETMLKNVALPDEEPDYQKALHVHFFHTVDSEGTVQTRCAPVGGHYHVMTVTERPGKPPLVECGPAVKLIQRKVNKKFVKEEVPVEGIDQFGKPVDAHVHRTTYLKSSKVKVRQINTEAMKVVSSVEQKGAPMAGVIS